MRTSSAYKAFRVTALVLVVLSLLAPLVWMVAASLKTNVDIYDSSKAVVFTPTLDNYLKVLQQANYAQFIGNSLWIAFASTALSLVIGVPAAYSMSRFSMRRSALVVLMARVIPAVSLLVPWYYVFSNLRMVGGFTVLVLSHMFVALPLIVYIMMGYFDGLPIELEESGLVDGLTRSGGSRCPCRCPASRLRASCPSSSRGTTSCSRWCCPGPTARPFRSRSSTSSATRASTGVVSWRRPPSSRSRS
jgi:multiple sugar transport system permease protein